MTTAREVLDRLAEIGATIKPAGDHLIVRAGAKPVPAELVRHLREVKAAVLAALAPAGTPDFGDAAWWRCEFAVRTVDRELGFVRPYAEAARLAWGELQNRWHRLHGERLPEWQCAGCDQPIGGLPALDLGDGNRAHLDRLDCVIRYGERWRGAATQALAAMGLQPPAGEDAP